MADVTGQIRIYAEDDSGVAQPVKVNDDGELVVAGAAAGGGSTGGGNNTYSNLSGDFTATANTGAKTITLSAYANSVLSSVLSAKHFATAIIKRVTSAGVVDTLPTTHVAFASNVLTLGDMEANFAAGDTVAVIVQGPDKGFDETNDAQQANLSTKIAGEDLSTDHMKVEERFSYSNITTNATTVVKTGAGLLHRIKINNPMDITVTKLTLTIYDNNAASGTKIGTITVPAGTTTLLPIDIPFNASFATGLTVVTAGPTVAADVTVLYR